MVNRNGDSEHIHTGKSKNLGAERQQTQRVETYNGGAAAERQNYGGSFFSHDNLPYHKCYKAMTN
jgi:hypothetical protein